MFTAIFHNHYGYLAACTLVALTLGGAAWLVSRRFGNAHSTWWAGLSATLVGVLGVTFMNSGPASGQCVINHNLTEPFHTTQGLWNLLMTVPLGLFVLLALRKLLPALVTVVAFPLAVEFTQGAVNDLGRVCDSADAEMNILGGLVGLAVAAAFIARRAALKWHTGAKGSLIASAALLALGAGVARPMLTFTNVDGTGLSAAGPSTRHAVAQVVKEAFGDRYKLGHVYVQPCVGAPCTNIAFTLLSRDKGHPEAFSSGNLSWPDRDHLNVLLEDSDHLNIMGYPVAGAKAPSGEQEAYRIAQTYMVEHYPWAKDAAIHRTYQVGEKAELGWITSWRWVQNSVLMPRMLDVQVDRAGRISQVDVTLGPTRMTLSKTNLHADQAEDAVREGLIAQSRANRGGGLDERQVKAKYHVKAFALKAVERQGTWRPEWLVSVSMHPERPGVKPQESDDTDTWWVDAVNGQVYDGTNAPVKIDRQGR
ncbi:VanZ family protein [Streptomyces murinus]|uniref:VanZ family protein n=1 Tax=Streptomyces murinus TaxID=33900 RepID=UPI00381171E2